MGKITKKKAIVGSIVLGTTLANSVSVSTASAASDITSKKLQNTISSSKRYAIDVLPALSAIIAGAICPISGCVQMLSFIYTAMSFYDESCYKKLYNFTDDIGTGVKDKVKNIKEKLNGSKNTSKTTVEDDVNAIKNHFTIVLTEYVRLKIKERIEKEYEEANKLEEFKKRRFPAFIKFRKETNNKIDEISKIVTDRLLFEKGIYDRSTAQNEDKTDASFIIRKIVGYIKSPFENIFNKKGFLKKIIELDELIEKEIIDFKHPKRKTQKKE